MNRDKYTAIWVSHSSIGDFLNCPRAYYLNNVYRNPQTGHKITIMSPPLALGQAVHEVIESLSFLPIKKRFEEPLVKKFEKIWVKVCGKRGGFMNTDQEYKYKNRGLTMLSRISDNPGPLLNLAVKIKMNLPYFWLSEDDNIILCGKIDWIEYLKDTDSIHIIDFKTSKVDENSDSLQLPIYFLLANNCQKRKVSKVSYWYLERYSNPGEIKLPNLKKTHQKILEIAKKIKLIRQLDRYICPQKTGCFACLPLESVVKGEAEKIGVNDFNQDVYILDKSVNNQDKDSIIL